MFYPLGSNHGYTMAINPDTWPKVNKTFLRKLLNKKDRHGDKANLSRVFHSKDRGADLQRIAHGHLMFDLGLGDNIASQIMAKATFAFNDSAQVNALVTSIKW